MTHIQLWVVIFVIKLHPNPGHQFLQPPAMGAPRVSVGSSWLPQGLADGGCWADRANYGHGDVPLVGSVPRPDGHREGRYPSPEREQGPEGHPAGALVEEPGGQGGQLSGGGAGVTGHQPSTGQMAGCHHVTTGVCAYLGRQIR